MGHQVGFLSPFINRMRHYNRSFSDTELMMMSMTFLNSYKEKYGQKWLYIRVGYSYPFYFMPSVQLQLQVVFLSVMLSVK